ILALAETYAEYSPSGKGIRLIARGKIEKSIAHRLSSVEAYRDGRYLTITGNHIPGTPTSIDHAPRTLAACQGRVRKHSEVWNKLGPMWKAIAEGRRLPTRQKSYSLEETFSFRSGDGVAAPLGHEAGRIEDALRFINADDRDVWVKMGMALRSH